MAIGVEMREVYAKAADILATKGHCKWDLKDDDGRHCAAGAVIAAVVGDEEMGRHGLGVDRGSPGWGDIEDACHVAGEHLKTKPGVRSFATGWTTLVQWNNATERTEEEVINLFKELADETE